MCQMSPWLWLWLYIKAEECEGIEPETEDYFHIDRLWDLLYEWECLRNNWESIWPEMCPSYGENFEVRESGQICKEFFPLKNQDIY